MRKNRVAHVYGWGTVRVPPGFVLFSGHPIEKRVADQLRWDSKRIIGRRMFGRRMFCVVAVRADEVPADWLCPRCRLVVTGPFLRGWKCAGCRNR